MRLGIQNGIDMAVVSFIVFTLYSKNWDLIVFNKRGGNIILCAQRIGGAQGNTGTTGL